jgi:hypothetical protein
MGSDLQIDEISATVVVLQSLLISKNALRGFRNPPAFEGNRRDMDRSGLPLPGSSTIAAQRRLG